MRDLRNHVRVRVGMRGAIWCPWCGRSVKLGIVTPGRIAHGRGCSNRTPPVSDFKLSHYHAEGAEGRRSAGAGMGRPQSLPRALAFSAGRRGVHWAVGRNRLAAPFLDPAGAFSWALRAGRTHGRDGLSRPDARNVVAMERRLPGLRLATTPDCLTSGENRPLARGWTARRRASNHRTLDGSPQGKTRPRPRGYNCLTSGENRPLTTGDGPGRESHMPAFPVRQ